jgi:hypothetical protein
MSNASFAVEPSTSWSDDAWYQDQDNRMPVPNQGYLVLNGGSAEGTILGGNLCTLNLLQGTEYAQGVATKWAGRSELLCDAKQSPVQANSVSNAVSDTLHPEQAPRPAHAGLRTVYQRRGTVNTMQGACLAGLWTASRLAGCNRISRPKSGRPLSASASPRSTRSPAKW